MTGAINDYAWFRQLCKSDVFLVTRLKSNARFRVIERHRTDRATGVTSDHISQVADGQKTLTLRRVGYRDQETGKCFQFLTNHNPLDGRYLLRGKAAHKIRPATESLSLVCRLGKLTLLFREKAHGTL